MMLTIKGDIPEADLRKVVTRQEIECGESVTTAYYDSAGDLVKQDCDIVVTKIDGLGGDIGEI